MKSKIGLEDQLEFNLEIDQDQNYVPKIANRSVGTYRSKAKLFAVAFRLKEDELYLRRCRDSNKKNIILSRYDG